MPNHQIIKLSHPAKVIKAMINLPASKSESNRVLIINALTGNRCEIQNLSKASDTVILNNILKIEGNRGKMRDGKWEMENGKWKMRGGNRGNSKESTVMLNKAVDGGDIIDVKDAGTAMRFLTAYYVVTGQNITLTGSPRMQERPIGPLVDALKELGADIRYIKNEGFPPIRINGSGSNLIIEKMPQRHQAHTISIDASISSQFISALIMIAPVLPFDLKLQLQGNIASKLYIEMTLGIMEHFGIKYQWQDDIISIRGNKYQNYTPAAYTVEPDWSAASYWYSITALANEAEITLPGLKEPLVYSRQLVKQSAVNRGNKIINEIEIRSSLQPDSVIADIMTPLGVKTTNTKKGIVLTKKLEIGNWKKETLKSLDLDVNNCPDIAQTIAVLCAAKGINLSITGIENLRIKETDRIKALKNELEKMGAKIYMEGEDKMKIIYDLRFTIYDLRFQTYNDHRMAMAFAPLGLLSNITINDPAVVEKSYPNFWKDLEKAGFVIKMY